MSAEPDLDLEPEAVVAEWLPDGIEFASGISFVEWLNEWAKIDTTERAIQWIIGDALVYGEANFPEWTQALDPKYAEKHRSHMWVAKSIPRSERREGFSYSFHRELASLDRETRDRWFELATDQGWNDVKRLREERTLSKALQTGNVLPMTLIPEPPLPESENDYGVNRGRDSITNNGVNRDEDSIPNRRVEELRQLLDAVRKFGLDGPYDIDTANDLSERLGLFFGEVAVSPDMFSDVGQALDLRAGRATIIEGDDDIWEVRYRAAGQKQAIATSPNLCCALIEAALAAQISVMLAEATKPKRVPRVLPAQPRPRPSS